MTMHSENLTRVQEELWCLVRDEDVRKVLEGIIAKMNKIGDDFEPLKHLYEEAQSYIPDNPEYDPKYWIAAYILHTNKSNWQDLFDELLADKIYEEFIKEEEEEERQWGRYYDVIGPIPAYLLMLKILNKVIEKTDYKLDKFEQLYYEMDEKLGSDWDDEGNLEAEDLVAMRIMELEKSTIGNIEDELNKIQHELHDLEYNELPYAGLEMYELYDDEALYDDEGNVEPKENEITDIEGRIKELENRIKELKERREYLLKMFSRIAVKLVAKYLVTE